MATTITRAEAVARIRGSEGRVISLTFIKRTTGEVRTGAFRLGVVRVKGDLGSGPAYRAEDHGLIRVWDMSKKATAACRSRGCCGWWIRARSSR